MAGFRKKMHEMFDFDVNEDANDNVIATEDQAGEAEDSKEITKEEVLKLVSFYAKKDSSIKEDIVKLIDLPIKTPENIVFDFEALALQNKTLLRTTIIELIDKDKDVQKIVDELATKPEPTKEPEPVKEPEPAPQPTRIRPLMLPTMFDTKRYTQELILTLREHPEIREQILSSDTDLSPRKAVVYFDNWADPDHYKPLREDDPGLKKFAYEYGAGDIDAVCDDGDGNGGRYRRYTREYRIADRNGEPTDRVFPLESKGSGKK